MISLFKTVYWQQLVFSKFINLCNLYAYNFFKKIPI